jgi:hypothetical protein
MRYRALISYAARAALLELLELAQTPPLSIMLQVSYTQLKTALPDLTNVNVPGEAQNGTQDSHSS